MFTFIELETCKSTNEEAWRHAPATTPILISARNQTKGKGRMGKTWVDSSPDNIKISILIPQSPQDLLQLPMEVGKLTCEALLETAKELKMSANFSLLTIKPPNDLLYAGKKLAGILCESKMLGERCLGVVIGLGLNIVNAPAIPEVKTACLKEDVFSGYNIDLNAFKSIFIKMWGHKMSWVMSNT